MNRHPTQLSTVFRTTPGEHLRAIADFDRAIKGLPDNPRPHILRGDAYIKLEKYEPPIAEYGHAIALDRNTTLLGATGLEHMRRSITVKNLLGIGKKRAS